MKAELFHNAETYGVKNEKEDLCKDWSDNELNDGFIEQIERIEKLDEQISDAKK